MNKTSMASGQQGGSHYRGLEIDPRTYAKKNKLDADQFSVIKYVTRHLVSGKGLVDMKKALHFVLAILRDDYQVRFQDILKILEEFFEIPQTPNQEEKQQQQQTEGLAEDSYWLERTPIENGEQLAIRSTTTNATVWVLEAKARDLHEAEIDAQKRLSQLNRAREEWNTASNEMEILSDNA